VAPNVPTLSEEGLPNLQVDLWFGLLAPSATPKEIVDRYNTVVNEILATPRVREALQKQGLTAQGGPPERLAELIAKDQPRWAKVVQDAGITPE
jgi:tripartite-type tricarboxylate transporter receptor subunit TctC